MRLPLLACAISNGRSSSQSAYAAAGANSSHFQPKNWSAGFVAASAVTHAGGSFPHRVASQVPAVHELCHVTRERADPTGVEVIGVKVREEHAAHAGKVDPDRREFLPSAARREAKIDQYDLRIVALANDQRRAVSARAAGEHA